jgi:hypothetical protein
MVRYLPLLALALAACAPAFYPVREITVSQRFGLVVPGGILLEAFQEGSVEVSRFQLDPNTPYAQEGLEGLGKRLKTQLEGRGFFSRCETYNALPVLGGPQYTLRMARGNEGVGLYLRALAEPNTYRLEVAPADPNPPLSCPAR